MVPFLARLPDCCHAAMGQHENQFLDNGTHMWKGVQDIIMQT